jgi:hypothetical protein
MAKSEIVPRSSSLSEPRPRAQRRQGVDLVLHERDER